MDEVMSRSQAFSLAAILMASVATNGLILFFGDGPIQRFSLGMLLLGPIVWTSARLGVVERLRRRWADREYRRRFIPLRVQVDILMREIRRLNWTALDARRGIREEAAVNAEMDAIEGNLVDIVKRLRTVAGEEAEGFEDSPDAKFE